MANPNWVAGHPGNPAGRPKGHGISFYLGRIGEEDLNGKTKNEVVARRLFDVLMDGKTSNKDFIALASEVMDRREGKAVSTNLNADITFNPFDGIDTDRIEALKKKLEECQPKK